MDAVDQAILRALQVNMGHRPAERVVVAMQAWRDGFPAALRDKFARSRELCERMNAVFCAAGVDSRLAAYVPEELRNGADAGPELYEAIGTPEVVFMPTVFSLTHTAFRRALTAAGARVASMPSFTLAMFAAGGPMDADYTALQARTEEIAARLRGARRVRIRGRGTDMLVEIDPQLVHVSSGMLARPAAWGNLPGAEAYVVPVHEGDSRGQLTVPAGWGGAEALAHAATLIVERGRFRDVRGESPAAQRYLDETVRPALFGGPDHDVLAELGIGTNANITPAYVARSGWSGLIAEKIGGSAHFANGNSRSMGGRNDVPVHIDWVVPDVTIAYDPA